ncbi:MAG: amidohydrolase family protein [Chloroflexi bacterium]|nr:amidohydrolase family protein [Chloroflexota bacterium]MCC6895311.1 amidohydrolase family protein [Anaerolineae bacterium]
MPEQAPWRFEKIIRPLFDLPSPHRILKGAKVITCVGDEVIENGFVEFEKGKIKAVGKASDLGTVDGAEVIDVSGQTVMPGMINSHAHLAWDGVHDLARQSMDDPVEISAYKSAANMLKSLRAGITLVRDLGMNKTNLSAKQAVEQGIFPGPRLLVCGEAIIQTGGHTYWCCREASGADEMRRAVREQVRGGADLIKIMASHDLIEMTDAELEAVIDETHRNGLPITAHATFNEVIKRVATFGVDVVEHGGSMDAETIQILLDKKIPIVTTFAPVVMQANAEVARQYNIPEWKIEERQKAIAKPERYQGLVDAANAGVPIAFGTDAGSPVVGHEVVSPELAFMVKVGVVPDNYAALRSATIVAARLSKLESKLGTLEAGKEADVIVVDGDPIADLAALDHVQMTFISGKKMPGVGN